MIKTLIVKGFGKDMCVLKMLHQGGMQKKTFSLYKMG